ncbi:hypothetical protein DFJ73DRAFT_142493 [Zopfochytrium polystomum]|nr:hypothetical protein DFJ73DRAFT_142493 [Zopfochytrium polystomum]
MPLARLKSPSSPPSATPTRPPPPPASSSPTRSCADRWTSSSPKAHPTTPVLPIFQQTRTGGFVDDARHPPLSFQRGDARLLSNNLEPGPVDPDIRVLPAKIAPDPSRFAVRQPGDIEIALHRSVEAYHDLQPAPSSPFVHGFNGLPGLGPWSIAGVIRITNNKTTALEHVMVSLDLSANMASKNLVKAPFENISSRSVPKHLVTWRLIQPSLHRLQIQRLGPRESFYASFRYAFTQVYPPPVDLIALNLNESATNTHYRLTVEVAVPRKGQFGGDGIVSLTKDISVFMYSKTQIADVLQSALRKRLETMQARAPEFPWKLSLAHSRLAPSDTAFLDITVGALLGTSTLPEITAVTVEIVEVIGYLRGESKFAKSKKVHTHATQKVCERYQFAPPTSNSSASSNTLLPLSWTRDDSPQLPDTTASQTALLRFATPPLVVDRRDAVPSPLSAKQDPQYPRVVHEPRRAVARRGHCARSARRPARFGREAARRGRRGCNGGFGDWRTEGGACATSGRVPGSVGGHADE